MAVDMETENSATESPSAPSPDNKVDAGSNPASGSNENNQDGPKESSTAMNTEADAPETKKDTGIFGKYNWDEKKKSKEKAHLVPPSGAIVDYAWSDGKKAVSIYITLDGLDDVSEEDLSVKLKDNKKMFFEANNVGGKRRFMKIDELNRKVKSAKLIRKKGKNQVVIKLMKEDEKQKWYGLKQGGGSSYDYDDDWSDVEDDFDADTMEEDQIKDVASGDKKEDKEDKEDKEKFDDAMEV